MRLILPSIFIAMVSVSAAQAAEPEKNCEVEIQYTYISGTAHTDKHLLAATSKKDCEKKAKAYTEVTGPHIEKKEVSVQWLGK